MKKKKSLNRKIVGMLIIMGLVSLLITYANVSALKLISQFNNDISTAFTNYEEAVKLGDEKAIEQSKADVDYLLHHSNTRIDGTYKFDYALIFVNALIIIIMCAVVRKTIVRPAQHAKKDLDEIIEGIESGKGDLTLRVFDKTGDEIGQLAGGINKFIEVLQELMVKIQNASDNMNESVYLVREEAESSNVNATNVSATSEQLAASMEEVSASLYELTRNCSLMLEKISEINESAVSSAERMNEVKLNAQNRYTEAVYAKEKTVSTFEGIQKNVVEVVLRHLPYKWGIGVLWVRLAPVFLKLAHLLQNVAVHVGPLQLAGFLEVLLRNVGGVERCLDASGDVRVVELTGRT